MSGIRAGRRAGFTLIEILVAMTILTIIVAVVYASFSSVVFSVEDAQAESERVRSRQFLMRSLTANLAQATEGWSPGAAFRTGTAPAGEGSDTPEIDQGITRYPFLGTSEEGLNGPVDSMSFTTSAPLMGTSLPGQLKVCTYTLEEKETGEERSIEERRTTVLTITETPVVQTGAGLLAGFSSAERLRESAETAAQDFGLEPRTWEIPVHAWDLAFYDGDDWREDWDSQAEGRLPWMVRARIRFTPPDDGEFATELQLDPETDPDVLELLFTIPAGAGVYDAPPDYVRPTLRRRPGVGAR